jgi:hypothetical protein
MFKEKIISIGKLRQKDTTNKLKHFTVNLRQVKRSQTRIFKSFNISLNLMNEYIRFQWIQIDSFKRFTEILNDKYS